MRELSLVAANGGPSSSRCAGLSRSRPLLLRHKLQMRRLSSCGSRAQLLHGMWNLPRPGLEPMSPALAGRFSITAPPGKPGLQTFNEAAYLTAAFPFQGYSLFLFLLPFPTSFYPLELSSIATSSKPSLSLPDKLKLSRKVLMTL